jgi:hypothetical protein
VAVGVEVGVDVLASPGVLVGVSVGVGVGVSEEVVVGVGVGVAVEVFVGSSVPSTGSVSVCVGVKEVVGDAVGYSLPTMKKLIKGKNENWSPRAWATK